jgi:O-antigen/teichoic acid export membrane protein
MLKRTRSFLFHNRTTSQTVLKNAFWLTFGQFFSRLIKAIVVIYAARILGAASYGIFSYALTLAALFTIFSDLGISALLTREVARDPLNQSRYLSTSLFIKFILISISILLIIGVAPFIARLPEVLPLLPIIAFLLAFDTLRDFFFAIPRAKERMEIEATITILTNIAIVVFGVLTLFVFPTSQAVTIAYTVGSGVGLLTALILLRSQLNNLWKDFDSKLILPILKSAWPFGILGLLTGVMINTDTIMIGWYNNAEAIGFYSAAQRPIQLLYLLPSLFATSLFPTFSRLAHIDKEKFRRIFESAVAAMILMALPIIVGGLIVAPQIISLLFGTDYLPSTTAFQILLATILIVFPAGIIGNAIFAFNQQKSLLLFTSFGVIGNVFANALLIPRYGIAGAAAATIVAQGLANGLIWFKMKAITPFSVIHRLPRILLATLAMGFCTWGLTVLGTSVIVIIPFAFACYLAMLFTLKEPLIAEVKRALRN